MYEFLHNLPAPTIWAWITFVVGAGITAIVGVIALKKYGPLQTKALEGLVKVYEKQIDAHGRAITMQKEHYEEELRIMRQERDEYKRTLHECRDEWHAESLKMKLLIAELEGRPDLSGLNATLIDVVKLIQQVAHNLELHEQRAEDRMTNFLSLIGNGKK